MIVERLVFRAKFGQGDPVAAAFAEFRDKYAPDWGVKVRVMVDVTGPMFTIVVENEYRDMAQVAELTAREQQEYAKPEFQQWFAKWSELTEAGSRELYRVVD